MSDERDGASQDSLSDFLSAFYPLEDEEVRLRLFKPKKAPDTADNGTRKLITTRALLERDAALQESLRHANRTRGIYFVVNSGGDEDAHITRFNAWFVEDDSRTIAEQHARLDAATLPPSIRVETRQSVHAYWLIKDDCSVADWREIQARLIAHFGGDEKIKNPSRLMRLPFFNHLQFIPKTEEVKTKRVELVAFHPERRYTLEEMQQAFPLHSKTLLEGSPSTTAEGGQPTNNSSFASWDELNAELKRRIMAQAKQNKRGIFEMRGVCHQGNGDTALMFNPATGAVHCNKDCTHAAVLRAFGLPDKPSHSSIPADASDRKQSQASRLVALSSIVEFFHTSDGIAYARVPVAAHIETVRVKSGEFRDWLIREYRRAENATPSAQGVQDALHDLQGTARFDSLQREIHPRIAEHEGAIYVDLCNDAWQAVKVTSEDWCIVEAKDLPVMFRRTRGMLPLPLPERGGQLTDLRRFINVRADDWPLVAAWLIAAFRPNSPFPVLTLHGEQGSAKSTTARIIRSLIDPNKAALRSMQRDERELMIAATNSWIIALDNLSSIKGWFSDALCRLATGGGFAVRENYSDDDEILFDAMRPAILNGIEELATRSDLLDRAIIINLPTITEENRREQAEVWREFEIVRPRLFGACLSAVVTALRNFPETHLERRPRMADFARFAVAAEPAFGCAPRAFLAAYMTNRTTANELALEATPIATIVLSLMEDVDTWRGTPSELLKELNMRAGDSALVEGWAKSPRLLSGMMKRLAPNLRACGVEVKTGIRTTKGRRIITIERCRKQSSPASPVSPNHLTPDSLTETSDAEGDAEDESALAPSPGYASEIETSDASDASDDNKRAISDGLSDEEAELAAQFEYYGASPDEADAAARRMLRDVPF